MADRTEVGKQEDFHHVEKLDQTDVESVIAVRQALGEDVDLMLDTNCAWAEDEAIAMARALEPARPELLLRVDRGGRAVLFRRAQGARVFGDEAVAGSVAAAGARRVHLCLRRQPDHPWLSGDGVVGQERQDLECQT